jgi:hypothetical protein
VPADSRAQTTEQLLDGGNGGVGLRRDLEHKLILDNVDRPCREGAALTLDLRECAELPLGGRVWRRMRAWARGLLAGDPTEELRAIAERKLPEVDAMLARAHVVRDWLAAAVRCECPSLDECCLFDAPMP